MKVICAFLIFVGFPVFADEVSYFAGETPPKLRSQDFAGAESLVSPNDVRLLLDNSKKKIKVDDTGLQKLADLINKTWAEGILYQEYVRNSFTWDLPHGMGIGLYSKDLFDKYSRTNQLYLFDRKYSNLSVSECLLLIKGVNNDICDTRNEIINISIEAANKTGSNELGKKESNCNEGWDKLVFSIKNEMKISKRTVSLFENSCRWADIMDQCFYVMQLSDSELNKRPEDLSIKRDIKLVDKEMADDIASLGILIADFQKILGIFIVENYSLYGERIDTLQQLHEKRALLLAELQMK